MRPAKSTAVEMGYHGFRAIGFPTATRFNYPAPGPGDLQPRRPYPQFGEGFGLFYIGDSNYNALEITIRQREFRGLSLQSSFTFSKGLGYVPDNGIMPERLGYYYGRMTNDYRKNWVSTFVYRVPAPQRLSKWARQFLAGWESAGVIQLQGGMPFSVFSSQNMNDNLNASRANLATTSGPASLPNGERTINRWFNTGAFTTPANFTWGNSGVNILDGPGFAQVDLALQKLFTVREGATLQFRAEASNLFNRVNLGQPGSTIGGSTYAAIRSLKGEPRNMQFAMRLQF